MSRQVSRRNVVNDDAILSYLRLNLLPDLEVVVIPTYHGLKESVEQIHRLWQQAARQFSLARVVIGPHGGAFNNLIWTPADCDFVEFNEFPDVSTVQLSHGGTPVRSVFLTAVWAKGMALGSRFWVIEPSMRNPRDLYVGRLRVALRELVAVLERIGGLLRPSAVPSQQIPSEQHQLWPPKNQVFTYVPPPKLNE